MSFWSALGEGAAGAIGSAAVSSGAGLLSGWTASSEARKAREWQKDMYKHRFRYTVKDMRAAGLNPILGIGEAGGAGSAPMADFSSAAQLVGGSVARALEAKMMVNSAKKLDAERRSAEADAFDKEQMNKYKHTHEGMEIKDPNTGEVIVPEGDTRTPWQRQFDSYTTGREAGGSSALAMAEYYREMKNIPAAQKAQIENAIKNANMTDFEKAMYGAGFRMGEEALTALFRALIRR